MERDVLSRMRDLLSTTRVLSLAVIVEGHAEAAPVQAVVSILDKDGSQFAAAATRFTGRFPTAGMTLSLGDFNLYEFTLGRGRYVEGFARAFNVGPQPFAEIATL